MVCRCILASMAVVLQLCCVGWVSWLCGVDGVVVTGWVCWVVGGRLLMNPGSGLQSGGYVTLPVWISCIHACSVVCLAIAPWRWHQLGLSLWLISQCGRCLPCGFTGQLGHMAFSPVYWRLLGGVVSKLAFGLMWHPASCKNLVKICVDVSGWSQLRVGVALLVYWVDDE